MIELRITIAGHMNHGKTSIVRTLTDDVIFGVPNTVEVACRKKQSPALGGLLSIFDTPGLELASTALGSLNGKPTFGGVVNYFEAPKTKLDKKKFDQELATLRQIQSNTDVILYVVGLHQPLLQDYKDEFHILRISGVPLIPIFNFVGCKNNSKEDWIKFLTSEGAFEFTDYDAHVWDPANEKNLWNRVKGKLQNTAKEELVEAWRDTRLQRAKEKDEKAASAIVELLTKVAEVQIAWREEPTDDTAAKEALGKQYRLEFESKVRKIEVEKLTSILDAYGLKVGTILDAISAEPILIGSNATVKSVPDLFGKTVLRDFGLGLVPGIVSGAVVGGTIDAFVGGASFGAGVLIGGLLGGALASGRTLTLSRYDKKSSTRTIKASPDLLDVVLSRALALTRDLRRRGLANHKEPNLASAKAHMPSGAKLCLGVHFGPARNTFKNRLVAKRSNIETPPQQVLKWIQQPQPNRVTSEGT